MYPNTCDKKTLGSQIRKMAVGFSWGNTSLSFAFIIYLLVSVSTVLYLVKYMYTQNKQISAMIVLVLLILVFIFFGRRWFQYGQLKGTSAWTKANALTQSGQTAATASTGQCSDGSSPASKGSSLWPPVVNHCPDFMTVNSAGACVDTNKLYGDGTTIGTTIIPATTTLSSAKCTAVTGNSATSKYLRWEGVVQAEGSCNPANIGKAPSK